LGVSVQNFTQLSGHSDFYVFIWNPVSGLMQFLIVAQKQKHVKICKELRQIASGDATLLSKVITGMRAGFMDMTLIQSNSPPNGK
jgi:hypothetical protein